VIIDLGVAINRLGAQKVYSVVLGHAIGYIRQNQSLRSIAPKAVLKNWQMDEAVCEAVGAQADVHIVRAGPPTLTDVLIASIRLAKRMQNSYDTATLNAGGAFARLDLAVEACKSLIAQASEETRALQRALRQ
jgi:HD-like signal output (HDOD) protein